MGFILVLTTNKLLVFAWCLLFFTAVSLRWYPLEGPNWLEKKKQIMKIHEEKEREYLEFLSKESKLSEKD